MSERWQYRCEFFHKESGKKRTRIVTLSDHERFDALAHALMRGPNGPGGRNGPIVRGYAMRRATAGMPEDFELAPENVHPCASINIVNR